MERYKDLDSFEERNDVFIRCAVELGELAIREALERAQVTPDCVDHIFFVSVTGIAAPSIDARLVNRLGLPPHIKRTPIFGLGCVAGTAGVARAADYLRAFPRDVAVLLSVELCSLTLQLDDLSVANVVASGLFGDGAAAVVLVGAERPEQPAGPKVIATRSVFYPDTEDVMGWRVTSSGFRIVLSGDVPAIARKRVRGDVLSFLRDQGLEIRDLACVVCHPGGPMVLRAFEESLELPPRALDLAWRSLAALGNLSSASVLMVLRDTLDQEPPSPGSYGLMLSMGPGFCAELVLLQW